MGKWDLRIEDIDEDIKRLNLILCLFGQMLYGNYINESKEPLINPKESACAKKHILYIRHCLEELKELYEWENKNEKRE